MALFSAHERKILALLAEAAIPPGSRLPGGGPSTVDRLESYLTRMPEWVIANARPIVWAAEAFAVPFTGRPFSTLDTAARTQLLERWSRSSVTAVRHAVRGALGLIKLAHFED